MLKLRGQFQTPAQDLAGFAVELRCLATEYVEMGRQLMIAADRIERGDGLQPRLLADIARRVVARLGGEDENGC